jgi:hypothetical protein
MRRLACLSLVLLSAAMPAAAGAQGLLGAPQIGTPTTPAPTLTTPATTNQSQVPGSGGGLTSTETLGILAFGIALIVVIAVIILTDARSKAPVADTEEFDGETPSLHRHRQIKAHRRAKGREAKAQRKKNRPRR